MNITFINRNPTNCSTSKTYKFGLEQYKNLQYMQKKLQKLYSVI